jgi:hypothetical protein
VKPITFKEWSRRGIYGSIRLEKGKRKNFGADRIYRYFRGLNVNGRINEFQREIIGMSQTRKF